MKLKAGALQFALVVFVVITTIALSLITLMSLNAIEAEGFVKSAKIRANAISGIEYGLANDVPDGVVDLFDEESDSVQFKNQKWGWFNLLTSTAIDGDRQFSKSVLSGSNSKTFSNTCLYIPNNKKALGVCGNVVLKGDAFITSVGLKSTYIEGKNFIGREYVNGSTNVSETSLPAINDDYVSDIKAQFDLRAESKELPEKLHVPFSESTQFFDVSSLNVLADVQLSGNIVLVSNNHLQIDQSFVVDGIQIYAKSISFNRNFSGNLQVFATDSIIVGEDAELNYPSIVTLLSEDRGTIKIREGAKVSGAVIGVDKSNNAHLLLAEDSFVEGMVYFNGGVDPKGKIEGALFANKLIVKTKSSVYVNQLFDTYISRKDLNPHFVGPNLFAESDKKIIRWLN